MIFNKGVVIFRRAGLGTTKSDFLIPFDRPQPAIKERCHVHYGELEAEKATEE